MLARVKAIKLCLRLPTPPLACGHSAALSHSTFRACARTHTNCNMLSPLVCSLSFTGSDGWFVLLPPATVPQLMRSPYPPPPPFPCPFPLARVLLFHPTSTLSRRRLPPPRVPPSLLPGSVERTIDLDYVIMMMIILASRMIIIMMTMIIHKSTA